MMKILFLFLGCDYLSVLAEGSVAVTNLDVHINDPRIDPIVDFLIEHQPPQDAGFRHGVTLPYLQKNARLALQSKDLLETLGLRYYSEEIFLNNVAPYAVFTEKRTDFRQYFFQNLRGLVLLELGTATNNPSSSSRRDQYLSLITAVNEHVWSIFRNSITNEAQEVRFISAPPNEINNYSIDEIVNGTHTNGIPGSSCTGMAIYMTAAFRSIGLPTRAVGTPHWNRPKRECPEGDQSPECGNHNWVEVWVPSESRTTDSDDAATDDDDDEMGEWVFLSPGDGAPINSGWFAPVPLKYQVFAGGNSESKNALHAVYATSWKNYMDEDSGKSMAGWNKEERNRDVPADYFIMEWQSSRDAAINAWDVTRRYSANLVGGDIERMSEVEIENERQAKDDEEETYA
mmetsp:Transcript_18412/g.22008  ORF Transcript_18412/g.22008 Transcript_18412/m.22008 type:complete len:401 (+) Transcript_18412:45-1247(+)